MGMELLQLRYAVTTADSKSFARAAAALLVKQSTLSRRVKELEERIGVKLFERSTRGAEVTENGKAFIEQARREMLPTIASIDGFEKHEIDELRRVLAGKAVGIGLGAQEDALVAEGATTPADLKLQLDLLGARLTATGWRPETSAQWVGVAPILVQNIRAGAVQVLSVALSAVLADGDARFGLRDASQIGTVTVDDLEAVVAPQLADGALSLGLVGDFDPEAAIAQVAATLGALPARPVRSEAVNGAAPVAFTADRTTRVLTHTGAADQGALALAWPTTDGRDQGDDYTRDLLAAVMNLRLTEKLREELGATYSPQALSYSQLTFDGFGFIAAIATLPPEGMDDAAAAVRAIGQELAAAPPAADLVERARNPIRASLERGETQNQGWVSLVAAAQSDPVLLDRRRKRVATLDAITAADLQAAAQRYLVGTTPIEIRVVPEAKP